MLADPVAALREVTLTGGGLTVVVLPEVGAKIISVVSERSGREFVWRDPTRPVGRVGPGARYADHDASGIDDCFPTVDACAYPGGAYDGMALPDHGDLWARGWTAEQADDQAVFTVTGDALPYRFTKRVRIDAPSRSVVVTDTVTLVGPGPLVYQWTGHPLLRAEPGMRVGLPAGTRARTAFSTGGRLAVDDHGWSWPHAPTAAGGSTDVSVVGHPEDGLNEKYWLTAPGNGCVLDFPTGDEQLLLTYDPLVLPYLAVCVNYGGWPAEDPGYWVAVEPSTSPHDALDQTALAGAGREITAGETHAWTWSLQVTDRPDPSGPTSQH